jgi:hypothetical protein
MARVHEVDVELPTQAEARLTSEELHAKANMMKKSSSVTMESKGGASAAAPAAASPMPPSPAHNVGIQRVGSLLHFPGYNKDNDDDLMHERSLLFKVGQRYRHDKHGVGTVAEILDEGVALIKFDNGDEHRYRPQSQHKLKPVMDDASQFTAQTLFKMVDTDNSGTLNLEE